MKRIATVLLVLLVLGGGRPASADEKAGKVEKPSPEAARPEPPKAEQSVTKHSVVIAGAPVNYTATAGTLIVRNGKDAPWASIGYVAYTKNDVADPGRRPLTFAYNGGPGSSSIWLHMGVLGPRRIVTSEAAATPPPPYKVVDNGASILDRTDLVMIDPVGTGLSKAVGAAKDKDFWGVDPDIESISRFIKQYVSDNGRWNSPKYLLGESYGSTRSGGIVDVLQTREGMSFNGVILVSLALDLGAIFDDLPGNERPYPLFLPTYAAVAWYHKVLPNRPPELGPFLVEVRTFALGPYAHALMQGHDLPETERREMIRKLHEYTGLSEAYLDKADLRVTEAQFTQELLREHRETVGRLDARFLGVAFDPLAEKAEYDPQEAAIAAAFSASFLDYYHRELKFGQSRDYRIMADIWRTWDFKHKIEKSEFPQPLVDTSLDLAHAMGYNPHLRVLVLQGLYDLATPFLATEWVVSHMNLARELRPHVEIRYYDAGHMMYIHGPDLERFRKDVVAFIDATDRL
jgi:carboxypeptidase C (cathepsin A)